MPPTAAILKKPTLSKSQQKIKVPSALTVSLFADPSGIRTYSLDNASKEKLSQVSVTPPVTAQRAAPVQNLFATLTKDQRLQKAIDDIDLRGSSSSYMDLDEDNEEETEKTEDLDTKTFEFLDRPSKFFAFNVESEDISSENIDYSSESSVYSEEDFFEQLQGIPDVDEISLEDTKDVKPKATVIQVKHKIYSKDQGLFVNPLTGDMEESDTSKIPSLELLAPVQAQEPESSEKERDSFQSKLSVLSDAPADAATAKKSTEPLDAFEDTKAHISKVDEEQETFLQFLEIEMPMNEEETAEQLQLHIKELMRQQEKQLNFEQTMAFLNNLIDHVVETAEYIDENVILRKNLDKNKLMHQLRHTLDVLAKEKNVMKFLNSKCTFHFRRRDGYRYITSDYTPAYRKKYSENLEILNQLMEKEVETIAKCNANLSKCREEYEKAKQKTDEHKFHLENLITSTFQRDKSSSLKECVLKHTKKILSLMNTISHTRLRLLLDQHSYSELTMQMEKLEDLGNGLNLKDYDNLETETKHLSKNLEERNIDLEKLQRQNNAKIHSISHIAEKQDSLRKVVGIQYEVLRMLKSDQISLRKYISDLKCKRMQSKKEIRDLSFQSGLLDKPILMLDYDKTVERANQLRHSNDELKKTIENLNKKIALLEHMCAEEN